MKKLLFSFLCVLFATITIQSYADPVIPHTGTYGALTTSEAGKIMNDNYSAQQNSDAYQGNMVVVSSMSDYLFDGFYSQKVLKQTILFYSQKENKNITREDIKPVSEMKLSWKVTLLIFLYYLVFGYLILKLSYSKNPHIFSVSNTLGSLSAIISIIGCILFFTKILPESGIPVWLTLLGGMFTVYIVSLINKKIHKILFFILSVLTMGLVSYLYTTPLFITACVVGLAFALVIRSRQVNLSKPETF